MYLFFKNEKLGINLLAIFIITFAMTLWMPALSIAGDPGGGKSFEDGLFWSADLNRNEQLDREEAKSIYNLADEKIFSRYDEDQSGTISRFEFMEYIQQSPWLRE